MKTIYYVVLAVPALYFYAVMGALTWRWYYAALVGADGDECLLGVLSTLWPATYAMTALWYVLGHPLVKTIRTIANGRRWR